MTLRDYVENKEHCQKLFEQERKKHEAISLLKGSKCDTCTYMILKNEGHYCGSFIKEPDDIEKSECREYFVQARFRE